VIGIVGPDGRTIAHGLTHYSHAELERIKGLKTSEIAGALGEKRVDEVVHRDDLVLIAGMA
jgi:glutamate 5-kinase